MRPKRHRCTASGSEEGEKRVGEVVRRLLCHVVSGLDRTAAA
jgi:hypothetical protein